MNQTTYLQNLASLTGLQFYAGQGPWRRKPGSVMGARDGYPAAIGFNRTQNSAQIVILLRFKKIQQPEQLKTVLAQNPELSKKVGKLGAVGDDFVRWEWKYSFATPKAELVAGAFNALRESVRQVAQGFDGRCEKCGVTATPSMVLLNGIPSFICPSCQQKVHQELDQAAMQYETIVPNHPNGLALAVAAALVGGIAWGGVAYAIHRIFLFAAILIGYLVTWAAIKGTGKVTRFVQITVPILTVASVLFGDAIFYTLTVMKSENLPFSMGLLQNVLVHLWELEKQESGIFSIIFALVGAGYGLFAARKPKFKASFEALGAPGS